jgi:hypothetical protein
MPRSSTKSIAAPRRTRERTATRSSTSTSAGKSSTGWQYTALVRGQVPPALKTRPRCPSGTHSRYGNRESGSGLRAITNCATTPQSASNTSPPSRATSPRTTECLPGELFRAVHQPAIIDSHK